MKEMDKLPNFKEIEARWQKWWLKNKIYKFDSKSKKKVFSIDTPPPYISGRPHMGHAVSYTGFEFIARYKRMRGFNVFFPIGFDDNGHPT
jgi:valyl-tRNA synthetase